VTNEEKAKRIRPWIDQTEGVTVQFLGEHAFDAIVGGVLGKAQESHS